MTFILDFVEIDEFLRNLRASKYRRNGDLISKERTLTSSSLIQLFHSLFSPRRTEDYHIDTNRYRVSIVFFAVIRHVRRIIHWTLRYRYNLQHSNQSRAVKSIFRCRQAPKYIAHDLWVVLPDNTCYVMLCVNWIHSLETWWVDCEHTGLNWKSLTDSWHRCWVTGSIIAGDPR
jgi:hypothetical protein